MNSIDVEITTTNLVPKYQTDKSSGVDLHASTDQCIVLQSGETVLVSTGLKMKIPPGYEGQIRPRSGLAYRHGIIVLNSPGTIDSDYRGEIKVILHNSSKNVFTIEPNMRIAQMIFAPYVRADFRVVDKLSKDNHNERGEGGFGSTGTGVTESIESPVAAK